MPSQRLALIIVALLILVLASGAWLWSRLAETARQPPEPGPAPSAGPQTPPPQTPTPLRAPPGYRLAGVAVGQPASYAVVEAPNGTHALYRTGADVPGLGRLIRIEAEVVVVQNDAGEFEMWLEPAATPTATRVRTPAVRAVVGRTPTPKPSPRPVGGGIAPGSSPSAAPGRPAS